MIWHLIWFIDKQQTFVNPYACHLYPEAYKIEQFIVTAKSILKLKLAAGGGAAVSMMPATADQQNN